MSALCCPQPSTFLTEAPGSLQVEDEFICCVCGGVMLDPVTIPSCGHDFGIRCGLANEFSRLIAADGAATEVNTPRYRCPHAGCDNTFLEAELRRDTKIRSLINKLTVACPNKCGWVGQWGSQSSHQAKVCPSELLACPFDCGRFVTRDSVNSHKKECLRRFEQCEHCLVSLRYQDLPLHEAKCEFRPIVCDGCGEIVQARGLPSHREAHCGGTLVSCPFDSFGCLSKPMPRRDVEEHIEENLHQHCLNLMSQIQKERAQHLETTSRLDARIRELEAQRGLTDSEHEAQTDALLRRISINSSNAAIPAKLTSRPSSAVSNRAPLSMNIPKAGMPKSATLKLLESLESVVSRQQQTIDRFMCGAVLYVDARLAACASSSSSCAPTFGTISAALKAAVPGDTIIVRPGTYKENPLLNISNVWVRGASKESVIITGCVSIKWPSSQPYFDGLDEAKSDSSSSTSHGASLTDPTRLVPPSQAFDNLALSNVTIRNVADAVSPAIRVKCEAHLVFPRVQNCDIISHNLACVVVDEGQPSFESCTMSESKQFGLFWRSKPLTVSATANDQRQQPSRTSGKDGGVHKEVAFVDPSTHESESSKDKKTAFLSETFIDRYFPQGPICGRIINCHIFNNKAPNIVVESGTLAIINTLIECSAANGVLIKSGANVHIEDTTVRNNGYSNIDVLPSACLRVTSSLIHSSKKAGLYVTGKAYIHSTRIFDNALPNVVVMPKAQAFLVNSKVNSSQQYGLVAKSESRVRLLGCEVKGNCFDNVVADPEAEVIM